ncbi:copper resistance CopC family protein [Sanguibacter sp. HDW7]|uniref:copper resistance CopC family protein n=1 Tax=Sanguibacter sp. HDW7 TaxID=2714931 RepID=UPI00140DD7BA|nr:copper resistance CopC family protein [Sanguibacter sp. HDW7]QIK82374.1 copper resistance protein CopC [Sanguibacter sp. HDW7]
MRLVRRGSCLLAALLLAVSPLLATPAAAHNPPPVPTPADGATLESAPAEVRLDYSAPILSVGSVLEVTGPDGAKVSDGPSVIGEKDVVQAITDGGPGTYTVVWRVTSEDGHPVDGTSSFTVEPATEEPTTTPAGTTPPAEATTTPAPTTQAPTTPAPTATATPAPEDGSNLLVRGGAVVLGLAALAAVVLVVRRMRA